MITATAYIQRVFDETRVLASDRDDAASLISKSKQFANLDQQIRLCRWLDFLNENFGKFPTTYPNFISSTFEALNANELFIDQTELEFEISLSFFNKLFEVENFRNCDYLENADYLLMTALIYGRYAGMQCRSLIEGLKTLNTRITNQEMGKLFEHLFVRHENPVILTNSLPALSINEIELLMFVLKGNSIRKYPHLPANLSKLECYHFIFGFSDQFQLTSHVLKRAAFMCKLMTTGANNKMVYDFCRASRTFSSNIDKALIEIDFWKDVYRLISSNLFEDFDFMHQYLDYVEYMKEQEHVNFSLKGATIKSMRRRVSEWHREMQMMHNRADQEMKWSAKGDSEFECSYENTNYLFKQLVSGDELFHESQELKHCVFSYTKSCARGETTIWNLSKKHEIGIQKMLTIEVRQNCVFQVAGERNRVSTCVEEKVIGIWAKEKGIEYLPGRVLM